MKEKKVLEHGGVDEEEEGVEGGEGGWRMSVHKKRGSEGFLQGGRKGGRTRKENDPMKILDTSSLCTCFFSFYF